MKSTKNNGTPTHAHILSKQSFHRIYAEYLAAAMRQQQSVSERYQLYEALLINTQAFVFGQTLAKFLP